MKRYVCLAYVSFHVHHLHLARRPSGFLLSLASAALGWDVSTRGSAPLHCAMSSWQPKKRERVKAKTNGRCAYCGIELGEKFHVDHLRSINSHRTYGQVGWDDEKNLHAACRDCNLFKSDLSLDAFRAKCETAHMRLVKHAGYRAMLRFHGILEHKSSITFYFETLHPIHG